MFGEVAVYRESLELIWRRQKSDTLHLASLGASSTGCNRRGRGKLKICLHLRAYIEAELIIFPSPRA